MSYTIDFFEVFECTGGECRNSCCSGWEISVDKETYDFYQNQHGTFAGGIGRGFLGSCFFDCGYIL